MNRLRTHCRLLHLLVRQHFLLLCTKWSRVVVACDHSTTESCFSSSSLYFYVAILVCIYWCMYGTCLHLTPRYRSLLLPSISSSALRKMMSWWTYNDRDFPVGACLTMFIAMKSMSLCPQPPIQFFFSEDEEVQSPFLPFYRHISLKSVFVYSPRNLLSMGEKMQAELWKFVKFR